MAPRSGLAEKLGYTFERIDEFTFELFKNLESAMAIYDESRVATIILRQFHGHGRAGQHTMPFSDLPTAVRSDLTAVLRCEPGELPVIAHYRSQDDWSVLTTRRLVARQESTLPSIAWSDLEDFKVDLNPVADLPDPKEHLATLTVVTRSGEKVTIATDPGPPFLAYWNCLIMATRMAAEEENRRGADRG